MIFKVLIPDKDHGNPIFGSIQIHKGKHFSLILNTFYQKYFIFNISLSTVKN